LRRLVVSFSEVRGQKLVSVVGVRGKHDGRVAGGGMSEPARVRPVPRCGADHDRDDEDREEDQSEVKKAGTRGGVGVDFGWHGDGS
jgi:hypothetical protein